MASKRGDDEKKPDAESPSDSGKNSTGKNAPKPHDSDDKPKDGGSGDDEDERSGDDADGEDDKDGDEPNDKKPSPLKKPVVRIALAIAAVLLVIAAVAWYIHHRNYSRFQQHTDDAYLSADQVSVATRVAGFVEEVRVGDNETVVAGQVLVRLQSRDFDAKTEQARAQIAQAQASVAQARAQLHQQQAQIAQSLATVDQSRAQVRQYEATERFSASEAARYEPLAAGGAEPVEKFAQYASQREQAGAQVDAARAQVRSGAAQVASARRQMDVYAAQVSAGEAQVKNAEAMLAAARVDLDATTLTSRIDGRIGDRTARVGQYVQAGTRLMTVVPTRALYLTANFKETQIGLMRVGQPASIVVDALPGVEIHGTVESFSPGTGARFALVPQDNATGNFTKIVQRVPVRVRVDADAQARKVLVPGLSATVSVDTRGAKDDIDANKRAAEQSKDDRENLREQEVERDKRDHSVGAGGG